MWTRSQFSTLRTLQTPEIRGIIGVLIIRESYYYTRGPLFLVNPQYLRSQVEADVCAFKPPLKGPRRQSGPLSGLMTPNPKTRKP